MPDAGLFVVLRLCSPLNLAACVQTTMSDSKVVMDLRPDHKLLNSNFDGYKLSLEPVPIYRYVIQPDVDHVTPDDFQYSFLHAKIFGLHNHLFSDSWEDDRVYFIDSSWKVMTIVEKAPCFTEGSLQEVWEIPRSLDRCPGHYNLSVNFPSSKLAVVSDGSGSLHVVYTGNRSIVEPWKVQYSTKPLEKEEPFALVDSRLQQNELHVLMLHIREDEVVTSLTSEKKSKFVSVLNWITFEDCEGRWSKKSSRELVGGGGLDYAAFEEGCTALYLASDQSVKFVYDSENPVAVDEKKPENPKVLKLYSWLQTADDLTLWMPIKSNVAKSDIIVDVTSLYLRLHINNDKVLEGSFHNNVDADLASWSFEDGKLELNLTKSDSGAMWPEILKGNKEGEEILDPALVEEVHQRLAHLCSDTEEISGSAPSFANQQLEECDELPKDTAVLLRIKASHSISHQVNLGSHQWLFNVPLKDGVVPAICVRHDVDACVWQMRPLQASGNSWPVSHIATFHAFGYVQASKKQRKFSICDPDMSYVAICDASRHIYLYHQPGNIGGELRNRHTGKRVAQVAKQQLVQLDADEMVLGCYATKRNLFILTFKTLYVLVIKSPTVV